LDLVRRNAKSAADAMRAATEEVNQEIAKTLRRNPMLRRQYQRVAASQGSGSPPAARGGPAP
jgi:hypothetical protein